MTSSEPDQRVLREVVLNQLSTGDNHAYRMWLPPLANPTPVNELISRDYDRRPLRIGLGVMDEPRRHRQEVWGVDFSTAAGNIAVGGARHGGAFAPAAPKPAAPRPTRAPRRAALFASLPRPLGEPA